MSIKDINYISIIGTAKSGTTALSNFIEQHPSVLSTPKEFPFFSNNKIDSKNKKYFQKLLTQKTNKNILISDVNIIYSLNGLRNLKNELGENNKIILILRHPTDRIISQYNYQKSKGLENRGLQEIIKYEVDNLEQIKMNQNDTDIIENQANYILHSNYPDQLRKLFKIFKKKQVQVLIYEEFFKPITKEKFFHLLKKLNLKPFHINFYRVNETVNYKKNLMQEFIFNPNKFRLIKFITKNLLNIKQRNFLKKVFQFFLTIEKKKLDKVMINYSNYTNFEKHIIKETELILSRKIPSWDK